MKKEKKKRGGGGGGGGGNENLPLFSSIITVYQIGNV